VTRERDVPGNPASRPPIVTRRGILRGGSAIAAAGKQKAPHCAGPKCFHHIHEGNGSSLPPASRQCQVAKKKAPEHNRGSSQEQSIGQNLGCPTLDCCTRFVTSKIKSGDRPPSPSEFFNHPKFSDPAIFGSSASISVAPQ
jgi:hypothetical protein